MTNCTDKSEYIFHLKGVAERPIAQEHIKLCVQAKTRYAYTSIRLAIVIMLIYCTANNVCWTKILPNPATLVLQKYFTE